MSKLETVTEDELAVGTYQVNCDGFMRVWDGKEWRRVTILQDLIQQCREDTARWFPAVKDDLTHMVLALNEEAGEVAGALKKGQRGTIDYDKAIRNVTDESIDVLIYLCNIWGLLGVDPVEVYQKIRNKNEKRFGGKNA